MTAATSNALHKVIAWLATSALAILGIAYYAGGFVSETKAANKEQTTLRQDIKKLSDDFVLVDRKLDWFMEKMEKKFLADSVRKVQEKEDELNYKKEVHNAVESCIKH